MVAAGEIGSTEPGGVLAPYHVRILEDRGLDPELAARLGWWTGALSGGGSEPPLVIPYFRNGRIASRKYRTFRPKKFWQDAHGDTAGGATKLVWNEDALRDASLIDQPLIITEGEMDALAAIQCGHLRTISVPDGAPKNAVGEDDSGAKYDYLREIYPLVKHDRVPSFILAADNDAAGGNLLNDLAIRLGRHRCKFLTYPWQADRVGRLKDLNETLVDYGAGGVTGVILRAAWMTVDGVYRMSDLPPVPAPQVFENGFSGKLAPMYKIRMGDFAVFTGIPSHGKTTFVTDLCCRAVSTHKLNVAFCSFEQDPQRDHRRNLRSWFHRKHANQQTPAELATADAWIDKYFSFVVPKVDDDATLEWLVEKLEIAVVQYGANIIVVDPWNELDHQRDRAETTTEYVGRAIKMLRRFAKVFHVHLIVVAHPTKPTRQAPGEPPAIPTLYDISDSANWFNKCDLGVIVHRGEGSTLIRVAKSRYHDEIGIPGDCNCAFTYSERRYHPLDLEDGHPGIAP